MPGVIFRKKTVCALGAQVGNVGFVQLSCTGKMDFIFVQ